MDLGYSLYIACHFCFPAVGKHFSKQSGAYCTTKQVATEYRNRESFAPQRGGKK